MDQIDGVALDHLVNQYGSPLFVVSERSVRQRVQLVRSAFESRYQPFAVAYSYKTNYLGGICAIAHQEGAWAEVVSGFEYDIAETLGVRGEHIVFNGPYKREAEIVRAAKNGSLLNVDSWDEIRCIAKIGELKRQKIHVGVRINAQIGETPWSKFGFNLESGEAWSVCKFIVGSDRIALEGIHLHIGTNILHPQFYTEAISYACTLARKLRDEMGVIINYIDLGGGFGCEDASGIWMEEKDWAVPPIDLYAEAVCSELSKSVSELGHSPLLIVEPGRFIIAPSVFLLTSVVAKKMRKERISLIVDAGVNILPSAYYLRHKIEPVKTSNKATILTDIYGPLCSQFDVLRTDVEMPDLERGDILVVHTAGAYTISNSMQFSQPRPAVVLINDGQADYLLFPEQTKDIRSLEQVPPRLLAQRPMGMDERGRNRTDDAGMTKTTAEPNQDP